MKYLIHRSSNNSIDFKVHQQIYEDAQRIWKPLMGMFTEKGYFMREMNIGRDIIAYPSVKYKFEELDVNLSGT